jgi:hypothetical protein
MPTDMPTKRKLYIKIPKITPIEIIHRHSIFPLLQKSTAGNAAHENLRAENNIGGNESNPISMTTKLNPHKKVTVLTN